MNVVSRPQELMGATISSGLMRSMRKRTSCICLSFGARIPPTNTRRLKSCGRIVPRLCAHLEIP